MSKPIWPEPACNPRCHCPTAFHQFFCMEGHMTECHAGYNCEQAGCSHLSKYDVPPDVALGLANEALERLSNGSMPPYTVDSEGNVIATR